MLKRKIRKVMSAMLVVVLVSGEQTVLNHFGYAGNVTMAYAADESMESQSFSKMENETTELSDLCVNYDDFIITSSDGSYARIEGQRVVEGDLQISCEGYHGFDGGEYVYKVHMLRNGESYSIEPTDKEVTVFTTDYGFKNEESNWGTYIETKGAAKVVMDSKGNCSISSMTGEPIEQSILTANAAIACDWLVTYLVCTDTGLQLRIEDRKLMFDTDNKTRVYLSTSGTTGKEFVGDVEVNGNPFYVTQMEKSVVVKDIEGNILAEKPIEYDVFFYAENGSEKVSKKVVWGDTVTAPNVTYDGYVLEGWYTSPDYAEESRWDFATDKVTDNICLYAKWKKVDRVSKVKGLTVKNTASETVKVSWKNTKNVSGYEISYSTSKKFSKKTTKKKNVTSAKKTVSIKKLKKGKTYYVRVRAYKMIDHNKVYSKYSSVKKVKIEK